MPIHLNWAATGKELERSFCCFLCCIIQFTLTLTHLPLPLSSWKSISLGNIYYFDAILSNSNGEPVEKKKVVCMHEEDDGLLWKHVEYRNGHNESRRGRELIISSIATVVNYEYLFYWKLKQDGSIEFDIKLSGELSTNLLSRDEEENSNVPTHGTIVAPGVNAQVHQHMFCARLDMAIDGHKNTVSEVDIVSQPDVSHYGNTFGPVEKVFETEKDAIRTYDATKSRAWKISNAEGKINPINKKATAYKLLPFTKGSSGPTVLTAPSSTVSTKGEFATANLWVTPHNAKERYPAGEYTPQGDGSVGLPQWTAKNRSIKVRICPFFFFNNLNFSTRCYNLLTILVCLSIVRRYRTLACLWGYTCSSS